MQLRHCAGERAVCASPARPGILRTGARIVFGEATDASKEQGARHEGGYECQQALQASDHRRHAGRKVISAPEPPLE